MITREYTFFVSILGIVVLNGITGNAVLGVTTVELLTLIKSVSGWRYTVYGSLIWFILASPSLNGTILSIVSLMPRSSVITPLDLYLLWWPYMFGAQMAMIYSGDKIVTRILKRRDVIHARVY